MYVCVYVYACVCVCVCIELFISRVFFHIYIYIICSRRACEGWLECPKRVSRVGTPVHIIYTHAHTRVYIYILIRRFFFLMRENGVDKKKCYIQIKRIATTYYILSDQIWSWPIYSKGTRFGVVRG